MSDSGNCDLIQEMIRILGYRRAMGQRSVYISDNARSVLDDLIKSPPSTATLPPRKERESAAGVARPTQPAPGDAAPTPGQSTQGNDVETVEDQGDIVEMDWEPLREAVLTCRKCRLCNSRTNAVFGSGLSNADLMFVGEGPGEQEDQQGEPFVGSAGQLLTRMIGAMQFTREDVFITNVVKCHPPRNRVPYTDEAEACLPYLRRQIQLVKPEVIVLLGSTPLNRILGKSSITAAHGSWYRYRDAWVMPTFHPSYLSRSPARKADAWEDLKKVMRHLGKDPEKTVKKKKDDE